MAALGRSGPAGERQKGRTVKYGVDIQREGEWREVMAQAAGEETAHDFETASLADALFLAAYWRETEGEETRVVLIGEDGTRTPY